MKNIWQILCSFIAVMIIAAFLYTFTPLGRTIINKHFYNIRKADDVTNYNTLKTVEDSCRAMIASYESDKLTYEQYKDSANTEERGWANQAKMRANKTANTYNTYILQNSFVWKDNVPEDIQSELAIIQ